MTAIRQLELRENYQFRGRMDFVLIGWFIPISMPVKHRLVKYQGF